MRITASVTNLKWEKERYEIDGPRSPKLYSKSLGKDVFGGKKKSAARIT